MENGGTRETGYGDWGVKKLGVLQSCSTCCTNFAEGDEGLNYCAKENKSTFDIDSNVQGDWSE